jgi:hypothetical protein
VRYQRWRCTDIRTANATLGLVRLYWRTLTIYSRLKQKGVESGAVSSSGIYIYMCDAVASISQCGVESMKTNAIINAKIEEEIVIFIVFQYV